MRSETAGTEGENSELPFGLIPETEPAETRVKESFFKPLSFKISGTVIGNS